MRKFLNIDTEHNTQQSQNAEARRPVIMLISTALLLDSIIRNSCMYSGKIAVPPGEGGIRKLILQLLSEIE
jgi:hypothetical protein